MEAQSGLPASARVISLSQPQSWLKPCRIYSCLVIKAKNNKTKQRSPQQREGFCASRFDRNLEEMNCSERLNDSNHILNKIIDRDVEVSLPHVNTEFDAKIDYAWTDFASSNFKKHHQ